ncbi:inorganic pyrophosphatase 2-like [Anaeramoeba flamelloides]|uniref:Inorganic pyrophosphatase 2-like n=1 Tax=Anaeramoeba flamelloides TaxID=1746091 RepID=A0AAV7Z0Z5_9EUKA|nr:inorganic pyrophosphatase 2-like [Anaeramoeba flamelloides]
MDYLEKSYNLYFDVKPMYEVFSKTPNSAHTLTIRLKIVMECLNILGSNCIFEGETQETFNSILEQLNSLVKELRIFFQSALEKEGNKPKRKRSNPSAYKMKLDAWIIRIQDFLSSEEKKKAILEFEKKLGDLVSTFNLAISAQMSIDVKKCLKTVTKNQELIQELNNSLTRIESRQEVMSQQLRILIDKQKNIEEKKINKFTQSMQKNTLQFLTKTQKLNKKGGKILFDLISQRECDEKQGLKASLLKNFAKLQTKRSKNRMKIISQYFFNSWDLDGNGYLSQEEVKINLKDNCYLASLRDYMGVYKVSYIKAFKHDKERAEESRLDLENSLHKELKQENFIEELFSQGEKSYYNDEGEINQKGFSLFCQEQEDCKIDEIFTSCITFL